MINVADYYDNSLENAVYSKVYNVKIHGVQTALNLIGYTMADGVNPNTIRYGYYCVNTEKMILQFQKENNIHMDGKLTEETWDAIFNKLIETRELIIIQTGEEEVSIIDIDNYIASQNEKERTHPSLSNGSTLNDNRNYPYSDSGKSYITSGGESFDNDLVGSNGGVRTHPNLDTINPGFDWNSWDNPYNEDSEKTNSWFGSHNLNGSEIFDNLMYNYIVAGGKYYNGVSYNYNLNGDNDWNDDSITPSYAGESDKDYDFVYNLLSNSIYKANWYNNIPVKESKSTTDTIKYYGGGFESSTNKPFFHPTNIDKLRKSKFDITIVYGAKGENARKIRDVTPISVSQQMDASGEPLYDIYEFVARDVSYGM